MHLYTKYRKWQVEWQVLRKNLGKAGIQWQRQPKKKWLAELLADQHIVRLILKFLKNTKIKSRNNKVVGENKQKQKKDQKEKN